MKHNTADLGKKIRIRTKREYGPYLDEKPNLPIGNYDAEIVSVEVFNKDVGSLVVKNQGFDYYVMPEDVELEPSGCMS